MASWSVSPKVTLFEKPNFSGRLLHVHMDMPDLKSFDNSVSSAIVHEGDWALYSEIKYSGKRMIIVEGHSYSTLDGVDNQTSSICRV
ncbi:gamma-crystallin M2-like [Haliotis asinina]|uniref:gamma-crystallin M2-like n=1 Tax=Haliotis asinina TaxID=109174 RepID=UPI003532759A